MVVSLCGLGARFLCLPGHLCSRCALVAPGSQLVLWLGPSHTVVLTVEPRKCAPSTHSASHVSLLTLEARASLPSGVEQAGPCQPLLSGTRSPLCAPPSPSNSPAVCLTSWTFCPLAPPLVGGPPCSTALHSGSPVCAGSSAVSYAAQHLEMLHKSLAPSTPDKASADWRTAPSQACVTVVGALWGLPACLLTAALRILGLSGGNKRPHCSLVLSPPQGRSSKRPPV